MSQTNPKQKHPPIVIELIDRRNSSYALEGSAQSGMPLYLDCPGLLLLKTQSVVKVPLKEGGYNYRAIRYIFGCDTIFVDEQEKRGVKPNPRHDVIKIEFGRLSCNREGLFVGLYDYLKACEFNDTNENKPDTAEPVFYEINTEINAERELEDMEEFTQAMTLLTSLRSKQADSTYRYDTQRLDFLCALFQLKSIESYPEKLNGLLALAKSRPTYFVELVNKATSDIRVLIVQAADLGVISTQGEEAMFIADNNRIFYKFKSKDIDDKIEELAKYFGSKKGELDFAVLQTQLEFAATNSVDVK